MADNVRGILRGKAPTGIHRPSWFLVLPAGHLWSHLEHGACRKSKGLVNAAETAQVTLVSSVIV